MLDQFTKIMNAPPLNCTGGVSDLAVAVSGGPDSMALAHLLCAWSQAYDGPSIHVLSVDHGLRAEAVHEIEDVKKTTSQWPKAKHKSLVWDVKTVKTRVQEEARSARYALMQEYCEEHRIQHLFLAHHGDDQIETFLFRLAKGSGLDGLCSMRPIQKRGALTLVRPLLEFSKSDLVEYCHLHKIIYAKDPSNEKDQFARVRLRKLIAGLEEEGLSFKRLATTTKRLDQARTCLNTISEKAYDEALFDIKTDCIEFNFGSLCEYDYEIFCRVIKQAMHILNPATGYGPRTEKIEALTLDIYNGHSFKKRGLGGILFSMDEQKRHLILEKERL